MKFALILISYLLILTGTNLAQTAIKGIVLDTELKTALAYVNIGIKNKNIGTSSKQDGSFTIPIPAENLNDTLTFSIVGYSELNFPIKTILSNNQQYFSLSPKATELRTVTITAKALVEKKFGIKNEKALVHFTDGSTSHSDIFEIAQLVRLDTILSKITSVNLLINVPRNDSATFRINFYRNDGNGPGTRIIEKSIIQTKKIDQGWLHFDLSKLNIYMKGEFFVAIEFLPSTKATKPIYYEVKLGGSAKSYVRSNSQGQWKRPPHHYKMHVTALVKARKGSKKEHVEIDDDFDTVPTVNLFSTIVGDNYSIFVHLPENYDAKKPKRYSVVYLLDGNAYFDVVADEARKLKKDVILVGVGYSDAYVMDSLRNRDYTYPYAEPQDSMATSGGGKSFLAFMTNELVPFIDKTYRTDTSSRVLMGHSLGGYFTLFALEEEITLGSHSFRQFVSASPSLHYGDQYLVKRLQQLPAGSVSPKTLVLTIGENELKEDSSIPEYYKSFIESASNKRYREIKLITETFPSFGHMDTAIPTFIKALKMLK
jgi:predicted alpha/beta superfamily hydrolase